MKVKIKSYSEDLPYLTPEKEYDVIRSSGDFFIISADKHGNIMCTFNDCEHLNGGSWEIVTESRTRHV